MPHVTLRHAARRLWRDRSVTVIALAILALGIAANTSVFTVVNAVLLKPLPFPSIERLVLVRIFDPGFQDRYESFPVNAAHITTWRDHCASCEDLAAIDGGTALLTGVGEAEQLEAADVTDSFFDLFGIAAEHGRTFAPSGNAPPNEAVISHALWTRKFSGDPSIVGRTATFDGTPLLIVGVLPAGAPVPTSDQLGDLVRLPPQIDVFRARTFTADERRSPGDLDYAVVARVTRGITPAALSAQLDALEPDVSKQTGDDGRKRTVVQPLRDVVARQARRPLIVLLAATAGLLSIVCVNLANLLLARHAGRRRDTAVQAALGASRGALLADALTESVLLASAGGVIGAGLAVALTQVIVSAAPAGLPLLNAVAFDSRVFAFCVLTTIGAGLLVGIIPALRNARVEPGETLKAGSYTTTDGPRGGAARRALVGLQAAVGAALLVVTGLLLLSFVRLMHVDRGFDTAGILTLDVALPGSAYSTDDARRQFYDAARARLRAMPGVVDVATTSRLPLRGQTTVNVLSYVGDQRPAAARPLANYRYVTPEYFATIGTPLLRGRTFAASDRGRQVVILSAAAAEALWPGQDAVGRQVKTGGYLGAVSEVIGVAADSRAVDLTRNDVLFTYLPHWLRPGSTSSFVVRASVSPASLAGPMRRAVRDIDRNVAIPRIQTMADLVDTAVADRRYELTLMVVFGCAAAVLAAFGVYGVVSYSVARRGREIGIRVALGARPADIRRLVIAEGLAPVAAGLAAGLVLSWAAGKMVSALLFDVRPGDPLVMAGAAATITVATLIACAGPARRAGATTSLR
jgi:predicted permease